MRMNKGEQIISEVLKYPEKSELEGIFCTPPLAEKWLGNLPLLHLCMMHSSKKW